MTMVQATFETSAVRDPWRRAAWWTVLLLGAPTGVVSLGMAILRSRWNADPQPMIGWLAYAALCWISVYAAWRWSSGRGLRHEVFAFRRLTSMDGVVVIGGVAAGFLIYPATQWVAHLFGPGFQGMHFDLRQPGILPAVALWAVVTTPICEEILFRGLAVAHLQARHWPVWAVGLVPTLAYAAIHLPYFGAGGALYIVVWGGMLAAIRLWRNSLTPCWLVHAINNFIVFLIIPWLRGA